MPVAGMPRPPLLGLHLLTCRCAGIVLMDGVALLPRRQRGLHVLTHLSHHVWQSIPGAGGGRGP